MSQQKHTPGPYSYGEDNDGWYLESESVKAKLGHGDQIAYCLSEDDARRISACLNACEGVSTERLENNPPIRLIEATEPPSGFPRRTQHDWSLL